MMPGWQGVWLDQADRDKLFLKLFCRHDILKHKYEDSECGDSSLRLYVAFQLH